MVWNPEKPSSALSLQLQSLTCFSARKQIFSPSVEPPHSAGESQHRVRWGTGLVIPGDSSMHFSAEQTLQQCPSPERVLTDDEALHTFISETSETGLWVQLWLIKGFHGARIWMKECLCPHISQVSLGKLEQVQSYCRHFSLLLLHGAPTPSCCSVDLLQDTWNQAQCFPAQCRWHLIWISNNLLLHCWLVVPCRAQPDRHLTFNSSRHHNEDCSSFIKGFSFLAGKLLKEIWELGPN